MAIAPDRGSDKQKQVSTTYQIALKYAERGIKVFAVNTKAKVPAVSNAVWGKSWYQSPLPAGRGGFHQASTDPMNLRFQFDRPYADGIGMPTGRVNNVIVADFDLYKTGDEGRNANAKWSEWEDDISQCQTVITQSGGRHVYFQHEIGHSKFELGSGIEIQTDGSYVLLPPSKGYQWGQRVDREDWFTPPWPAAPAARSDPSVDSIPVEELVAMQKRIQSGDQWHNNMVRAVASLHGKGLSDAEILRIGMQWQLPGYAQGETFDEIYTALQGAKVKWARTQGGTPTAKGLTHRFEDLWEQATPDMRRVWAQTAAQAVREMDND